jgi:hypothetical protein
MAEDIVGSKMHPEAFYGQVGDATPSSKVPGDPPIKRSKIATAIIKGTEVTVPASAQVRQVSSKSYPRRHADGLQGGRTTG